VLVATSLDDAMMKLSSASYVDDIESVFVIGGAAAFEEALTSERLHKLYLTEVHGVHECDTFVSGYTGDHLTTVAHSVRSKSSCLGNFDHHNNSAGGLHGQSGCVQLQDPGESRSTQRSPSCSSDRCRRNVPAQASLGPVLRVGAAAACHPGRCSHNPSPPRGAPVFGHCTGHPHNRYISHCMYACFLWHCMSHLLQE